MLASDQPLRLTSLAFSLPEHSDTRQALVEALEEAGADVTVNNLWGLGWLGGYDMLSMSRRILAEVYDLDINELRDAVPYCVDSTNDAPMFDFFRHLVGVRAVRQYLSQLSTPPAWITHGPRGAGLSSSWINCSSPASPLCCGQSDLTCTCSSQVADAAIHQ
ncbi:Uncharacterised protein [Pseudomonas synxantha]|uniref:Uncharacterized protein n=1 Tax=Pseudomonas synxantha TaxID=47883 RepID=A0AAX3I9L2_9PSED|nr:Uncharacterised protein [Pseudomonas synxantha]